MAKKGAMAHTSAKFMMHVSENNNKKKESPLCFSGNYFHCAAAEREKGLASVKERERERVQSPCTLYFTDEPMWLKIAAAISSNIPFGLKPLPFP